MNTKTRADQWWHQIGCCRNISLRGCRGRRGGEGLRTGTWKLLVWFSSPPRTRWSLDLSFFSSFFLSLSVCLFVGGNVSVFSRFFSFLLVGSEATVPSSVKASLQHQRWKSTNQYSGDSFKSVFFLFVHKFPSVFHATYFLSIRLSFIIFKPIIKSVC